MRRAPPPTGAVVRNSKTNHSNRGRKYWLTANCEILFFKEEPWKLFGLQARERFYTIMMFSYCREEREETWQRRCRGDVRRPGGAERGFSSTSNQKLLRKSWSGAIRNRKVHNQPAHYKPSPKTEKTSDLSKEGRTGRRKDGYPTGRGSNCARDLRV